MATPRRLYIYLVSAISLQAFTWAIIDILRGMLIAPFNADPKSLAWHIAIILVSLPVFLVHWLWGQRLANRDKEEREANLRALYLYGMLSRLLSSHHYERIRSGKHIIAVACWATSKKALP